MKQIRLALSLIIGLALVMPMPVFADESASTNYRVDQTFFGTGGELENSSASYRAKTSVGELGVGDTASASYLAKAGFNTGDDPFLEFVVTGDNIDLGYLETSSVKTATGNFQIRAWRASGYSVITAADPPTNIQNASHSIDPMGTPGGSSPGTEQFGINLADNASPNIGAPPVQLPDASFSFGQVDGNYDDVDSFRYVKGERIAYSSQSTSVTQYTISYIFNINNITPSGEYRFSHILVAVGTY